jgi:hypothetical protein
MVHGALTKGDSKLELLHDKELQSTPERLRLPLLLIPTKISAGSPAPTAVSSPNPWIMHTSSTFSMMLQCYEHILLLN